LEDRRPNSAADPYKVAARIIKTVKIAEANLAQVTQGEKKVA
jgi:glutamine synthetase